MTVSTTTPIAIVGLDCLFPAADSPTRYWANLRDGVDAITDVPPTHWRPEDHYDADPKAPDMVYARRGGFLTPIDFEPLRFGIAPRDLEATDTTQLLALHVAARALEDAGLGDFDRERTGVILGVTGALELVIPLGARLSHPLWRKALREAGVDDAVAQDVIDRISDGYVPWQENSFPGLLGNVTAGRIANRLDLHGTNCVVDAACASSLSALHLAMLELQAGRADVMLSGGVDAFNDVFMYTCFSKTPALSPTGDARPFDNDADGTMLGEGVGVVVLKRLADAKRDGDRIYAVLRGMGTSSDGKGQAIYAPSSDGQARALRQAYDQAGVEPRSIGLVEAHGTGTKVGDATELRGLASVYGAEDGATPWCALGSVKSMIGHTKAAAGVAGLIKASLALHHRVLPPTLKVSRPNEALDGAPAFYVSDRKRPWLASSEHPRRAAVSAFGFGGSNFHCVLEEAEGAHTAAWDGDVQLLAFRAASRDGLTAAIKAFSASDWDDLRRKAHASRNAFEPTAGCRVVVPLRRGDDVAAALAQVAIAVSQDSRGRFTTPAGAAFGEGEARGLLAALFPGQGAQSTGMLSDLACFFPEMRSTVERVLTDLPEVRSALYPPSAWSEEARAAQARAITATQNAQPALGAVSMGALEVLRSFDVVFDAAVGHSYGELSALCAAGVIPLDALGRVSRSRGELMAKGEGDRGTMLAVAASLPDVEAHLRGAGLSAIVIANRNSPTQMVCSGTSADIEAAAQHLEAAGVRVRRLDVAAAFHSPLVAAAEAPFAESLSFVKFGEPDFPVYANVSAEAYTGTDAQMRATLARQIAAPVEFVACIEAMVADGVDTFVEVGPGRRLSGLVRAIAGDRVQTCAVEASSGKRPGLLDLACALAALAAWGHPVDLHAWDPTVPPARDDSKPTLRTPICGANLKPEPVRRPPVAPSRPVAAASPTPAPASTLAAPVTMSSPKPSAPVLPAAPSLPTLDPADPLAALLALQAQTAQLHQQFLEGQTRALQALGALASPTAPSPTPPQRASVPVPVPMAPTPVAVAAKAPAPKPATVTRPAPTRPPAAPASGVTEAVLAVVSEKTGYPVEMLEPGMGLDADLGIDSIKRVEILSALGERRPDLPVIGPEQLGSLQTLADVIDHLGGRTAAPAPKTSAPAQTSGVLEALLTVVSEKTGYPVEMLEPSMGLDADLGIDSIKRVEILSALGEQRPELPAVSPDQLGTLQTLADVVTALGGQPVAAVTAPLASTPPVSFAPATAAGRTTAAITLDRYAVRPGGAIPSERRPLARGVVWVKGEAEETATVLRSAGFDARPLESDAPVPAEAAGLVVVPPLDADHAFVKQAFGWTQDARRSLQPGALLAFVTRMGGAFGLTGTGRPLHGAFAGLAKTAAREWEDCVVHAVDVASLPEVATAASSFGVTAVELAVHQGSVSTPALERLPAAETAAPVLGSGDVVLVSGGARGVTAQVARALAAQTSCTLVLLGRSPVPGDAGALDAARSEAEIRATLLSGPHPPTTPAALRDAVWAARTAAEIRETLAAIEAAGARAVYRSCDVRDAAAVRSLVSEVTADLGPVRGLIHGAGVLADKVITDKTDAELDRVYDTKVLAAEHLLAAVDPSQLRMLVMFSSSTARFGRVGQADYAMANEVLNKLAQRFAATHPHVRVRSACWGPWDGGMVTPALAKMFATEGVRTIGLEAGAQTLLDLLDRDSGVEVVVLGQGSALPGAVLHPTEPAKPATGRGETVFARTVGVEDHPFLASHAIGGKAVLPAAMMLEWFAHAATAAHPGLCFVGLEGLEVYRGVKLGRADKVALRIEASAVEKDGSQFRVPMSLCSGGDNGHAVVHARTTVVLAPEAPASGHDGVRGDLPAYAEPVDRVYATRLFHGSAFQGITSIDGLAAPGINATVRGAPRPKEWMQAPARGRWITEPLAIDCGLQAVIVWSATQAGSPSLPSKLGAYRQFRPFPAGGTKLGVRIAEQSGARVVAHLDWYDNAGTPLAQLTGAEFTLDPGLARAFTRNSVE